VIAWPFLFWVLQKVPPLVPTFTYLYK